MHGHAEAERETLILEGRKKGEKCTYQILDSISQRQTFFWVAVLKCMKLPDSPLTKKPPQKGVLKYASETKTKIKRGH